MASVELLTEGRKPTLEDLLGKRRRKATPVDLSPELARKPFMMPDGTTMRDFVTGEEVFLGHWEAYRSGIETELGLPLTEDEYEEAAVNFVELLGPILLHTCEGEAAWINESSSEYYDYQYSNPVMTTFYNAISRTIRR